MPTLEEIRAHFAAGLPMGGAVFTLAETRDKLDTLAVFASVNGFTLPEKQP